MSKHHNTKKHTHTQYSSMKDSILFIIWRWLENEKYGDYTQLLTLPLSCSWTWACVDVTCLTLLCNDQFAILQHRAEDPRVQGLFSDSRIFITYYGAWPRGALWNSLWSQNDTNEVKIVLVEGNDTFPTHLFNSLYWKYLLATGLSASCASTSQPSL